MREVVGRGHLGCGRGATWTGPQEAMASPDAGTRRRHAAASTQQTHEFGVMSLRYVSYARLKVRPCGWCLRRSSWAAGVEDW